MFWFLIALLLPTSIYGIGKPHYECGEHGRFEYCIDGIPGCVMGCHCHPGYYFDVETKICEPNAKLVQDYRRLYGEAGPTRVPDLLEGGNLQQLSPTPTTLGPLDAHVENIAKESDDLGDWLYNQFFKTIENQVINSTDSETGGTRRSGKFGKKSKKKSANKIKGSKKKNKKGDLRRKLLRISEDDSLFDSSDSSSGSDSDSSSGGSSDSSGSGSNSVEDTGSSCNDDKEHKYFSYISKKAPPALPSFIFLPNAGTPFFPPLGLPPPPMPMFPIIPVPPMFPQPPCNNATSSTVKPNEIPPQNIKKAKIIPSPSNQENSTAKPDEASDEINKKILRAGKHKQRKKILKQLQEKMNPMKLLASKIKANRRHDLNDILSDPDNPVLDGFGMNNEFSPRQAEPPLENVDFKYLAQLIHKMDNNTKQDQKPQLTNAGARKFASQMNHLFSLPIDGPSRTQFNARRILESPNDAYYSNLGQQIASLIRNIDGKVPAVRTVTASQPVFSENSYAPRTYWERSVRSLLSRYRPYVDEQSYLRNQEDSLFNLEKKVENYASTVKTLSLNDLENYVSMLDKTKSQLQISTEKPATHSKSEDVSESNNDRSLNVNLLPRQYVNPKSWPKNLENFLYVGHPMPNLPTVVANNKTELTNVKHMQTNLQGVLMNNFKNIPKYDPKKLHVHDLKHVNKYFKNITEISKKEIANLQRMVGAKLKEVANSRNHLPKIPWLASNIANMLGQRDVHLIANKVIRKPINLKFAIDPRRYNYQNSRHFMGNNDKYLYHKTHLPVKVQVKSSSLLKPQPSYFHHELQHFDFFDK